jgi:hypothetical protein
MQIKCSQSNCEVCGKLASIQVFYNKSGAIKYGRARHYLGRNNGKPQFEYHPQSIKFLKDLLKAQSISLTTEKAMDGQVGHKQNDDLLKPENCSIQQNICGRRLVWLRTLAFQANDPGFKSRRPHHLLN